MRYGPSGAFSPIFRTIPLSIKGRRGPVRPDKAVIPLDEVFLTASIGGIMKKAIWTLFSFMTLTLMALAADEAWLTNYDEALAKAKAENKLLMVEFHGSDWCPPCIKLNAEVLTTDAFKAFAKEELVLLNVDFPRRTPLSEDQRTHNEALAQKFALEGVPMVLLLDGDGTVLDRMVGFPRGGLEGFMDFLKSKTDK